jgi:hypothetical protein
MGIINYGHVMLYLGVSQLGMEKEERKSVCMVKVTHRKCDGG